MQLEGDNMTAFIEGKDYILIRDKGVCHFDYIIRIRVESLGDVEQPIVWELGVLNLEIASSRNIVNSIARQFASFYGYTNTRLEVSLLDYTPKK